MNKEELEQERSEQKYISDCVPRLKLQVGKAAAYFRNGDPIRDVLTQEDVTALVLWADWIMNKMKSPRT